MLLPLRDVAISTGSSREISGVLLRSLRSNVFGGHGPIEDVFGLRSLDFGERDER